ncbi:MAG TPA: HAD-IA family hydrolase [Chloroflexia bacterium]|jgi:HAD superfamily hydrolase (TIGR01509 family)
MPDTVLFLDDGGVISDNNVRAPQWQRLVGEFFPPLLGGRPEDWERANQEFTTALFEPAAWAARLSVTEDYESFERSYFLDWLGGMCKLLDIPMPPEEESIELARRASAWITRQVRSDFPGAVDAVRLLHARGYLLHTASGESSSDLEGYLGAMGVRECFDRLYGPDLVHVMKAGPEFYRRVFADSGVRPQDALVVDDSPNALRWAAEVGARTILIGKAPAPDVEGLVRTLGSLAELPGALDTL